jgi:hypothetical protein
VRAKAVGAAFEEVGAAITADQVGARIPLLGAAPARASDPQRDQRVAG